MQGLCAVGDGEAISRDLKAFISGAIMQMWQHPSACQSGSSELPQALAIKCPFSSLHFVILLYPTKAMALLSQHCHSHPAHPVLP